MFHQFKLFSVLSVPYSHWLGYVLSYPATIDFRFTFVQDTMVNEQEYIDLGLFCAEICKVMDRGLDGRRLEELGQSALEAIRQLTTWVASVMYVLSGHSAKSQLQHCGEDSKEGHHTR